MFRVVYLNDYSRVGAQQAGPFHGLLDAGNARKISGDVVIDDTGHVVQDPAWLWDWEKKDPTTYAHRRLLSKTVVKKVLT